MNSLKDLINSKKTELKQKLNNKNWISQNELRNYEISEYINKQRENDLRKVLKSEIKHSKFEKHCNSISDDTKIDKGDNNIYEPKTYDDCDIYRINTELTGNGHIQKNRNEDLGVNRNDTIKRLRLLGEPITLFGETDIQRYERLLRLEIQGKTREEINIGQKNIFVHDFDSNISLYSVNEDDKLEVNYVELKQESGENNDKFVLRWIETQLYEWERILKQRSKSDAETDKGRYDSAQYYQTRRDIQPLIISLKYNDGKVDREILDKLHQIVVLCCEREYIKAQDKYIELAIGNAPWPMGVTMVGIHERAGRTKIFSSQIAHVLNDETTRKYIQMFKRLITHCETRRPKPIDK